MAWGSSEQRKSTWHKAVSLAAESSEEASKAEKTRHEASLLAKATIQVEEIWSACVSSVKRRGRPLGRVLGRDGWKTQMRTQEGWGLRWGSLLVNFLFTEANCPA